MRMDFLFPKESQNNKIKDGIFRSHDRLNGIELQSHSLEKKKFNTFPDKLENVKLKWFLKCINYAEAYIEHLAKLKNP